MRVSNKRLALIAAAMTIAAMPSTGYCYVGPGIGITLLGSLWAVLAAVVMAIAGILFWPVRALLRRRKRDKQANGPDPESNA